LIIKSDPERWQALNALVDSGVSLNEIQRTLGVDHRTVRRYFPDYRPFDVGGGGEAAVVRETNRKLREFERRGRIMSDRDAGFKMRRNV